jgi:hypothetical protein
MGDTKIFLFFGQPRQQMASFEVHAGFLPDGGDLHSEEMTITQAKQWCLQHPNCLVRPLPSRIIRAFVRLFLFFVLLGVYIPNRSRNTRQ